MTKLSAVLHWGRLLLYSQILGHISEGNEHISGLYYKTITIVLMTIVSDATIWSITYDRN
jgi:hypothetical protein